MKILRINIRNEVLILAALAFLVLFIFLFIDPANIIDFNNKNEVGKVETFVKEIARPQGVVVDKEGRIFVQSAMDGKISIINKDGVAMDYSYIEDYFGQGIAIDNYNNFIIAMYKQVVVIDNSGNILRSIDGFLHAYDVAAGPDNTIFVSDSETNKIYSISPNNEISVFAEFNGEKSAETPNVTGICFDWYYKNLYAVNMNSGVLYKIGLSDTYKAESTEILASKLQKPNFIDVDEDGNAYITCSGDNSVVRVNQNSIKEFIGTKGKFINVTGIAVNKNGSSRILYVASKESNCIYKIYI